MSVIHGVQQLVLVYEGSNHKVEQTGQHDFPALAKDTVNNADDEDQNRLGKIEAIAECRWLYKLGVV